jgi:plasmid stabilization system protein ParE
MKSRLIDAALEELRGATRYYRLIRPELGVRFRAAVDAALDRIEQWPLSGAPTDGNIRICRLKRFPYGIVYVPRETEIVIVAVMHLHRRPGYWKRRLKGLGP